MRLILVLWLTWPSLASAVQVDQALVRGLFDHPECGPAVEQTAGCLRALNSMFRLQTGKAVEILLKTQLNDVWRTVLRSEDEPAPFYDDGTLVLAEMSADGRRQLREQGYKKFAEHLKFNRGMENRFRELAESGFVTAEMLQHPFKWVATQMESDDEAKTLFGLYQTARLRETTPDRYVNVKVTRPTPLKTTRGSIEFARVNGHFRISRLQPKSWADDEGLRVGMILHKVDDELLTPDSSVLLLRKPNSQDKTKMTFLTDGGMAKEVIYEKRKSEFNGVHEYIIPFGKIKIGVIELRTFALENLCVSVAGAAASLARHSVNAVIVDLRSNGGGLLDHVTCIAGILFGNSLHLGSQHLLKEALAYEEYARGRSESMPLYSTNERVLNVPVVFAVNFNSGSGSEILSGAAQDLELAWVVGQRTFGKGIGQAVDQAFYKGQPLDGFSLTHTFMRFHFVSGRSPHIAGVTPDFPVSSTFKYLDLEKHAQRLVDIQGRAFEPPPVQVQPSVERLRRKQKISNCVAQKLTASEAQARIWLLDLQLRRAAKVAYCSIFN